MIRKKLLLYTTKTDLPEGVVNYVTQGGMDELLNEKQELISEKRIWKLPMKMKGCIEPYKCKIAIVK
jgi:hypothetical protein